MREGYLSTFISITSLPDSLRRFTSAIIPMVSVILQGIDSINDLALATPTAVPSSSQPIYNTPPAALAYPQIHSRYSSFQVRLNSILCVSVFMAHHTSYFKTNYFTNCFLSATAKTKSVIVTAAFTISLA